jgi:hypothetical protein
MKLGIMQPYLFPYIGYFQLISAVDKFVVYDDVNFIKAGWINRNNLLINKSKNLFTVPLKNVSTFSLINETKINRNLYGFWKTKLLKSIEFSYKKAPYFDPVYSIVKNVLDSHEEDNISKIAVSSIKTVNNYLDLNTEINDTSTIYNNENLKGQERVLDICIIENAKQYINLIGGVELYSKDNFIKRGIILNFMKSNPIFYNQFHNEFVPSLSIIDVLMFNSVEQTKGMIKNYELV